MRTLQLLQDYLFQTWGLMEIAIWVKTKRDRHLRLLLSTEEHPPKQPEARVLPTVKKHAFSSAPRAFPVSYDTGYLAEPPYIYLFISLEEESCALIRLTDEVRSNQSWKPSWESLDVTWLFFRLLESEETIYSTNYVLSKTMESTRSISSSLDLDRVIHDVIRNTLSVIPAADAGLLHMYDPKLERLVPRAAVGFRESVIHCFRLQVGESIAGKVFQDGQPRIFHTQQEVQAGMADLSLENYEHLNDAKELRHLHGLMSVPISRGDQRIGVLVIHQFHQENFFLNSDLQLLQDVAHLTAIALDNARLYADTKAALEQTAQLGKELQLKHNDLVKRTEIHEALKNLSLKNKGAAAIIHALGRMVGQEILLYDALEQQVHSSHKRPAIEMILSWDELNILMPSRRHPLWVTARDNAESRDFSFCFFPLLNGSVFLGCLAVRSDRLILSDLERLTIEQGTAIITLELVKKQSLSSVFFKRSHDFFQHLLTSKGTELTSQAQSFGLIPGATYLCVHGVLLRCYDLARQEAHIHRIVTRWKQLFAGSEVITYGFHNQLTMLVDVQAHPHLRTITERMSEYVTEWNQHEDCLLAVGVGGAYSGLEAIAKSFEEAKKAVQYLNNRNRSGVVRYDELGVNQLMINQTPEDMQAFVRDVFRPFWEHHERYAELEKTLLTYIKCSLSANQTASELHIHINTLYQRLRKIESLLRIDLKQPEDLLKIQLACHLRSETAGTL
ncbi:helix-turn-helix domain-containing protein [Brevibacillus ruminantium]|uniref:Helix-turn-helix domain-containing protein n=1 Tax=Brevibacillus ruminantium TaxID=2950604 RepID=A0ABY4WQ32_9BACL|nr:helix-turn-helix domain-containing protein [Brevibacillus ruminantium]USG68192.1 helix-turn-helix domain-containing protein [Brevibacillus ruminantium]